MKVIFLDLDGVVNSLRSAIAFGNYPHELPKDRRLFDPVALGLVRRICKETGAVIVISSTWRRSHHKDVLKKSLNLDIIGCTPAFNSPDTRRGHEIKEWLDYRGPQVEKYCIIDDDSDVLNEQLPFFVKVYGDAGLSAQNYQEAIKILGKLP